MTNRPLQEMAFQQGTSCDFDLDGQTPEWVQSARECAIESTDDHYDEDPLADEWLTRYVRSAIDRCLLDSHSVEVEAYDGRVTLRGHVAPCEILCVVAAVAELPEVRGVDNQLEIVNAA